MFFLCTKRVVWWEKNQFFEDLWELFCKIDMVGSFLCLLFQFSETFQVQKKLQVNLSNHWQFHSSNFSISKITIRFPPLHKVHWIFSCLAKCSHFNVKKKVISKIFVQIQMWNFFFSFKSFFHTFFDMNYVVFLVSTVFLLAWARSMGRGCVRIPIKSLSKRIPWCPLIEEKLENPSMPSKWYRAL